MKKTVSIFAVLAVVMVVFVSISASIKMAKAQGGDYSIEHVDHTVGVMYNGYILINDTLRLNITQAPSELLMGFPDKYGAYVVRCVAYSGTDNFPVVLNVPLEGRVGFYGVRIEFPSGAPSVFSVIFVLSNGLLKQDAVNTTQYILDFPAYPSLTKKAALCNGSIVLPTGAIYSGGTVGNFTYAQENLQEFTHSPDTLVFLSADDKIQIADISRLEREVRISEFGEIEGADNYEITNKADKKITYLEVFLPLNASNPSAEDQFGTRAATPTLTDENTNRYLINLTLQVEKSKSSRFIVKYSLPTYYLTQGSGNKFNLTLSLFRFENYFVNQSSISFIFPEGARVTGFENNLAGDVSSVSRSVFQETLAIDKQWTLSLDNLSIEVEYEYNPMWLSFRPTIWVWTLAIVGCAVVAVSWRQPKGPTRIAVPTAAVKVRPDHLKSLIDAYEEKMKINLEMETLEERVQKGKIPRRRYKVRMKTLEARLNTLSRTLADLKEKMRASGGKYAEMMLQLEVAESEIDEVGANIKNAETLHNRGELSLEAYRKRLADYEHRKENAETTINGILLRLREETR